MKKLFSILCVVLVAVSFCACNDDTENPYQNVQTITLTSVDVSFEAPASVGEIVFEADGVVTATSTSDWCTPEVIDNTVKVSVTQNTSVVGRSAVVKLQCGDGFVDVAVVQGGVMFQFEKSMIAVNSDEAQTLTYELKSNIDLDIVSAPDWATVTLDGNTLTVELTANETGHLRQSYVKFQSEEFVDSLEIIQADFAKDIAGNYTFYYTDEKGRNLKTRIVLTADEMQFKSQKLNVPIKFNKETMSIDVNCGQYCGKQSSYFIYLAFATMPSETGSFFYSQYVTDETATGKVKYGDLTQTAGKKGNFISFDGYFSESTKIEAFVFWRYLAQELTDEANTNTFMLMMCNPYMEREITSAE